LIVSVLIGKQSAVCLQIENNTVRLKQTNILTFWLNS